MQPEQFARLGQTRSVVRRNYALIAPDSHVPAPLARWSVDGVAASGVVTISPALGARFSQTEVTLTPGTAMLAGADAETGGSDANVETLIYVLQGALECEGEQLSSGSFVYAAPGEGARFAVRETAKILTFERRFVARAGHNSPARIVGHEAKIEGKPFLGDPDARLKLLLPDSAEFDMAVNIFTYQPGATLPFVETHVMEHGLLMLQGEGIYRLGDDWHPVAAGDTIWMASFCPQWFAATGKTPARYLYYKDVNRNVSV